MERQKRRQYMVKLTALPGRRQMDFAQTLLTFFSFFPLSSFAATSVEIASDRSPFIGSAVTLVATTQNGTSNILFRFRFRTPTSTNFRTVVDFSPRGSFEWVPAQTDGDWQVEVTALNQDTGESSSTTRIFHVLPRVTNGQPVLTPTLNELVYLYSAPPCAEGSKMRVQFDAPDGFRQFTPAMECTSGKNINVYLAGMRANTTYKVRHVVTANSKVEYGSEMSLTTGPLRLDPKATKILEKPSGEIRQGILLQSKVFESNVATDFEGEVVWYCPAAIRYLTRPEPGGYFFALYETTGGATDLQLLRQIDLAGSTVLETNAAQINRQLDKLGKIHITSFHHEARRLPDGKIMVLAGTEKILTDVQGDGPVDVIGDMILVLNRDLQVEWVWDAFEHMDTSRTAVLDEKCMQGGGGCPEFYLADVANDWLHGNSLQITADGNILYSARHQDWVLKIDYRNGDGSGDVLWRLGKDGDFQMMSDEPYPWFSHQHDPNFERGAGSNRMVLFDNGNTRFDLDPEAHSRGQLLDIDEKNRQVTLGLNIDLGEYSLALGSAQRLASGGYHFDLGWMPNGSSQALEYDSAGNLVSKVEVETPQYRSFRMRDLYTP